MTVSTTETTEMQKSNTLGACLKYASHPRPASLVDASAAKTTANTQFEASTAVSHPELCPACCRRRERGRE